MALPENQAEPNIKIVNSTVQIKVNQNINRYFILCIFRAL